MASTYVKSKTGLRFGRLLVGEGHGPCGARGKYYYYNCICDCGTHKVINAMGLRVGGIASCGCLCLENTRKANVTHGMKGTSEYETYRSIMKRCYNPKDKDYKNYGARGITVSEDWKLGFENFFRDMGKRPSPEMQLDRRKNEEGYSRENCHWTTRLSNMQNRRSTVKTDYFGESLTLMEISEKCGVTYDTLLQRYTKYGDRGERLFRPARIIQSRREVSAHLPTAD